MAAKKNDGEKVNDENFEEFVLRNEERILKILADKNGQDEGSTDNDNEADGKGERMTKILADGKAVKKKLEDKKEKGKEFAKGVAEAAISREVTEHLMSAGIEFMMGISALVKAFPWPDDIKPYLDAVSERKETAGSVICKKNPNCSKASIEKIELN